MHPARRPRRPRRRDRGRWGRRTAALRRGLGLLLTNDGEHLRAVIGLSTKCEINFRMGLGWLFRSTGLPELITIGLKSLSQEPCTAKNDAHREGIDHRCDQGIIGRKGNAAAMAIVSTGLGKT